MLETTCTYLAKITNHQQVRDELDQCGFAASKLWNVGRYYIPERFLILGWSLSAHWPTDFIPTLNASPNEMGAR